MIKENEESEFEFQIGDSFPYLFTKKKKFFLVYYKGITFTDKEVLRNFERKEKLDNILDDKELKDDYRFDIELPKDFPEI